MGGGRIFLEQAAARLLVVSSTKKLIVAGFFSWKRRCRRWHNHAIGDENWPGAFACFVEGKKADGKEF